MPPTLKRRPSSDTVTVTTASDEPSPKKQKLVHPTRPPPAFWDNLSDVPLIASALRELDRRNNAAIAAASPHTPTVRPHPPHRPLTRRAASEQKKLARTSLQLATEYLASPSSTELRKIRSFARQGGPNLSHLRAVRHAYCCSPATFPPSLRPISPSDAPTSIITNLPLSLPGQE